MEHFKKILLVITALSIASTNKAMTDSETHQKRSEFEQRLYDLGTKSIAHLKGQYTLSDLKQRQARAFVQKMARNIGLKATFYINGSRFDNPAYNGCRTDSQQVKHFLILPEKYVEAITQPWFKQWFKQMKNPELPLIKGVIYHELGHAKSREAQINGSRIYLSEASDYKTKYDEEVFADNSVPDEKEVLIALREAHFKRAKELESTLNQIDDTQIMGGTLGDLPVNVEKLRSSINHPLDLSSSLDEEAAQQWDYVYREFGHSHPSEYRRAHNFNERIKILEACEQQKVTSFDDHIQNLMLSDLL